MTPWQSREESSESRLGSVEPLWRQVQPPQCLASKTGILPAKATVIITQVNLRQGSDRDEDIGHGPTEAREIEPGPELSVSQPHTSSLLECSPQGFSFLHGRPKDVEIYVFDC